MQTCKVKLKNNIDYPKTKCQKTQNFVNNFNREQTMYFEEKYKQGR
jgi:hypothetical protein